jgi:hypothetical protein
MSIPSPFVPYLPSSRTGSKRKEKDENTNAALRVIWLENGKEELNFGKEKRDIM